MPERTLPDSLWVATANAGAATRPLDGDHNADVAIVGAGFCGLRAALVLREAGVDVAVIDAGEIGWGASGRAGGQVNPIGHQPPAVIHHRWRSQFGEDYAARFVKMYINSADELFALVNKYQIQCEAEQNGWIRGLHSNAAKPQFEKMYQGWRRAGAKLRLIERAELATLSGCNHYRMGWVAASGGSVQPLSYVRGLAAAAIAAGANIFTHTHARTIRQQSGKWRLKTDNGTIAADYILLCTNGYTDKLYQGLHKSLLPIISIQAATAPLTATQSAQILPHRHTFADTRRVIFYFKKTADNRLVFGSAGTTDETPGKADKKRIMAALRSVYPQFPALKIEYIWGGRIAFTADHLPHIHQPAAGVYAGLGCNGRGVAMATIMGRLLAELVLGKPPDELPLPISPIKNYPLHRFQRIGLRLAVPWMALRDRIESTR